MEPIEWLEGLDGRNIIIIIPANFDGSLTIRVKFSFSKIIEFNLQFLHIGDQLPCMRKIVKCCTQSCEVAILLFVLEALGKREWRALFCVDVKGLPT